MAIKLYYRFHPIVGRGGRDSSHVIKHHGRLKTYHSTKQHAYEYILSVLRQGKTSAGTPIDGDGGGGGGGGGEKPKRVVRRKNPKRPYGNTGAQRGARHGNTGAQQRVFGINSVWNRKTEVADTLLRRKSLNRQEPQIGIEEGESPGI
ncbi:hypothetical protein DPMN_086237 [Dreissena polymorpha]|uniref:Uncharacterized protein n=1 Tax=Dreissena polymorpha TaxID=45954 RepID=A0A9D4BDI4_DREPO|nr:hypothetical protein DPMN_086237 [Dreissena polymorpha]